MAPKSDEPLGFGRILGIVACLIIIGLLIFSGITGKGKEYFEPQPGVSSGSNK